MKKGDRVRIINTARHCIPLNTEGTFIEYGGDFLVIKGDETLSEQLLMKDQVEVISKAEEPHLTFVDEPEEEVSPLATQIGGSHYQLPIQPIDYIVKNNLGYREGNVVKYVTRHGTKNGAEDIKKAIHYLEMILEGYEDGV